MFVVKTLGLFFLLPLTFIYNLLKDVFVRFIISLYRGWRTVKKYLLSRHQAKQLGLEHQFLSIPTFIIVLSIAVLGFNIHSRQQGHDFNSQSLLDRIFNEVEEFTVIESVLAQGDIESPTELLAALESTITPASENSTTTISKENLQPMADANGALVRPNITSTASAGRQQIIDYVVQPGDTISNIAEAHGITTATLLWANNLSDHSIIRPDEKIKILPASGVMHIIASGDTLSSIAKKYDVDIEKIVEANELVSEHQLQIKQGLMIPGGKPPTVKARTTQLANFGQIFSSSPAVPSQSGFIWPTPSRRITQYYWLRHKAIDVGGSSNNTIVASKAGRVEYAGWSTGYGYNIILNHGNGVKTRYAHLRQLWVKTGAQVGQGGGLGKKGTTGRSTGIHLHFEIIINGIARNPLSYL